MTEEDMQFYNGTYITRKQFIDAANNLWKPLIDLRIAWENLSHNDNGETSVNCPFPISFDEWVADYFDWLAELIEKFDPKIKDFSPTVTVKDLKQILSVLDDNTQIVISDKENGWWTNIKEVELPSDGIFTLVFHPTNDFEATQF